MFEFLFKYPSSLFAKGNVVFLTAWPTWLWVLGVLAGAIALGLPIWQRRKSVAPSLRGPKTVAVWALQGLMVALLLVMLWQPALSVATLKPRQNIVAVLLDDSRSMATKDDGTTRHDMVLRTLNGGLLKKLQEKFQVRLYRLGDHVERIEKTDPLNAALPATHLAAGLKEVLVDSATLPIGAVVLMSDGGDNSGGIDLQTISEIRRHRIPVHTIGYGREKFAHDVEISDVITPARALADSRLSAVVSLHQHGYENQKARITLRDGQKTLATQEIKFKTDGAMQTETLLFNAGAAGARNLTITVDPLQGEENVKNNSVMRLVHVTDA